MVAPAPGERLSTKELLFVLVGPRHAKQIADDGGPLWLREPVVGAPPDWAISITSVCPWRVPRNELVTRSLGGVDSSLADGFVAFRRLPELAPDAGQDVRAVHIKGIDGAWIADDVLGIGIRDPQNSDRWELSEELMTLVGL